MTTQQLLLGTGAGQSLTFVTSNTGTGTATARMVLTHPVSVQVGDLCVLFQNSWDNDDDFVDTAPTGFSMINTDPYLYTTTTYMAHAISYNVLASTASVTLPFGNANTQALDNQAFTALYFRPSRTITSVNFDSSVGLQETTGDPSTQTVRGAGNTAPLVAFGQAKCLTVAGSVPFAAGTTAFDGFSSIDTTNIDANVGYKIYNTSPVDHTVDMADNGTNVLLSFYLRVA